MFYKGYVNQRQVRLGWKNRNGKVAGGKWAAPGTGAEMGTLATVLRCLPGLVHTASFPPHRQALDSHSACPGRSGTRVFAAMTPALCSCGSYSSYFKCLAALELIHQSLVCVDLIPSGRAGLDGANPVHRNSLSSATQQGQRMATSWSLSDTYPTCHVPLSTVTLKYRSAKHGKVTSFLLANVIIPREVFTTLEYSSSFIFLKCTL